jgi:hypothetical protein
LCIFLLMSLWLWGHLMIHVFSLVACSARDWLLVVWCILSYFIAFLSWALQWRSDSVLIPDCHKSVKLILRWGTHPVTLTQFKAGNEGVPWWGNLSIFQDSLGGADVVKIRQKGADGAIQMS